MHNGIGPRGCASLAKLLENPALVLTNLHLGESLIDDKSAIRLANALTNNNKLRTLCLHGNDGITAVGWRAMLNVVCNCASMKGVIESNHTLADLGMQLLAHDRESIDDALGINDADLLRSSLEVNRLCNKAIVMRRKIIWCQARGNINIGDSSIATAVMPHVLACFADDSEVDSIQYHDPPLPKTKIDAMRLDSVFRIVQTRPDLCGAAVSSSKEQKGARKVHLRLDAVVVIIFHTIVTALLTESFQTKLNLHDWLWPLLSAMVVLICAYGPVRPVFGDMHE